MNLRQGLEIEEEDIGELDLHGTWTKSEVDQTRGFYDVGDNVSRSRTLDVPPTDKQSFCRIIKEKLSMISTEKVALEVVFPKDFQAHLDDFDNNDGGGDNDDDGSDIVDKENEPAGKSAVNEGKDGVNAEKDGVNAEKDGENAEKEGEVDVNEEQEDIFEEETFTQWIETNSEWVGEDLFVWPRAVQPVNVVCPQTPQRVVTRSSPKKRFVKPSSYLTSPYMNKKTKVIPLIKRLAFVLDEQVLLLRCTRFKIATKILLHELNVYAQKMFDLAYKFETENDEQTRISIIVNAIKNRAERDPAKTKTVVENQEEDAGKSK
ncbi:hypothetical protein Tco_0026560 [Tanacetum coccineum]